MKPDSHLVRTVSPSPNFGGRHGRTIDALVLHYTDMRSGEAARARLIDPCAQVSCHYLVWEDGRIEQLVAEANRAWHAGRSCWAGDDDMNSASIGIEIVNGGHAGGCPPYPGVQIDALLFLVADICARSTILPSRVLGHSDIAPQRKRDPGEWFPWQRFANQGLCRDLPSLEPRVAEHMVPLDNVLCLQQALTGIGYDCPRSGEMDPATVFAIVAFQRRFRPTRIDGVADGETQMLIAALR